MGFFKLKRIVEVLPCVEWPGWYAMFLSCGHGDVTHESSFVFMPSQAACRQCSERRQLEEGNGVV